MTEIKESWLYSQIVPENAKTLYEDESGNCRYSLEIDEMSIEFGVDYARDRPIFWEESVMSSITLPINLAQSIVSYTKAKEDEIATEWGQDYAVSEDFPEFYHYLKKQLEKTND